MKENKASDMTRKWHYLRSHYYGGKKTVDEVMQEYSELEQAIALADTTDTQAAFHQLQVALILWREDVSTREEAPHFLQRRYNSMDAIFCRVLRFLEQGDSR